MRAVVQRVNSAVVRVEGREISAIGQGLLVLLGIGLMDEGADVDYMVKKNLWFENLCGRSWADGAFSGSVWRRRHGSSAIYFVWRGQEGSPAIFFRGG